MTSWPGDMDGTDRSLKGDEIRRMHLREMYSEVQKEVTQNVSGEMS